MTMSIPLRIAQVAPMWESVPPATYGGVERVVSHLTEELVRLGHDVTLFASGDSVTRARLISCSRRAWWRDPLSPGALRESLRAMSEALCDERPFDVVHFHTDYLKFPEWNDYVSRAVTTAHLLNEDGFYDELRWGRPSAFMVSLTKSQASMSSMNWVRTINLGLDDSEVQFNEGQRPEYLAFMGRLSPNKGPERAISIAQRSRLPIKLAGRSDELDGDHFRTVLQPLLTLPGVEYIGEVGGIRKAEFLSNAIALLFPISVPEAFGTIMVEAMACGTPVVGFNEVPVTDVVDGGLTGWIVKGEDEAVEAVAKCVTMDRKAVRRRFEERFTVARMAANYVSLYKDVIHGSKSLLRRDI